MLLPENELLAKRRAARKTLDDFSVAIAAANVECQRAEAIPALKPSALCVKNLTVGRVRELLQLVEAGDHDIVPVERQAAHQTFCEIVQARDGALNFLRGSASPAMLRRLEVLNEESRPLYKAVGGGSHIVELRQRVEKLRAEHDRYVKASGCEPVGLQLDFDWQNAEAALQNIFDVEGVLRRGREAGPQLEEIQRQIAELEKEILIP